MPAVCHVYCDGPHDGPYNMAADEALLELAMGGDEAATWLRFYTWSRPTLSLGYFQRIADANRHPASREAAVVRRQSGGGAILHHHELTYSLAVAAGHHAATDAAALYEAMHASLIEALATMGVTARRCGTDADDRTPFLCFSRRAENDVLIDAAPPRQAALSAPPPLPPAKIAGSAQRRKRGAILQHGSILLKASSHAPELQGVYERTTILIAADELRDQWLRLLPRELGFATVGEDLGRPHAEQTSRLMRTKYASDTWTSRR